MVEEIIFLIGRLMYGGILAFMGINHFTKVDDMAGYAEFKGIPSPKLAVLFSGFLLVFGGLSIAIGFVPLLGVIALALFFIVVTPTMHDFWNVEGEQKQSEMTGFLKNVGLLGTALILYYTIQDNWGILTL